MIQTINLSWPKEKGHSFKKFKEESGYILGLVMIFFIVFTLLGLAFIKMGGFERLHVSKYYHTAKAFYYADGGIHKGMWLLNHVSKTAATFSDSNVTVVYDSVNLVMTTTGTASNLQDSIKVTIIEDGTFKINRWEEL